MRITLAVVVGLVALLVPGTAAAVPPGNDDFANAAPISSLPFTDTVSITEATTESGEQAGCFGPSQTAWWSYTPAVDTVVRADTFGSTISGSYVVLWEATGPGLSGLSSKDCAIYYSSLTEKLRAGTTYYFQAGSFYGVFSGDVTLNVQLEPPPAFDSIATATPISGIYFSDSSADSSFATTSSDDPSCFGRGATVWYVYVPTEDMRLEAALQPPYPDSPSDFTLSAYAGSPGRLSQLDCSDDSLLVQGYPKPHIELDARAGVPVYFMIGTSGGTEGGPFYFTVQRPLEVAFAPAGKATVTKAGALTLSGSVACSRPTNANAYVTVRQTFAGRLSAFGFTQVSQDCSATPSRWTTTMTSWPVSFGPGGADVEIELINPCDSQGCQPGALWDQSSYGRKVVTKVSVNRSK
jgi:hypothetical protein